MNAAFNRAIEYLTVELANELSDEMVEQTIDEQLTTRGRACKEALQTAGVLTTKLHAIINSKDGTARQLEFSGCETCNDL